MSNRCLLLVIGFLLACTLVNASDLYPNPSWSLGGIASWAQPRIASGAALPAIASGAQGDLFIQLATAPVLYIHHLGTWTAMAGAGTGTDTGTGVDVGTYTIAYDANGADSGATPSAQIKSHDVDIQVSDNTGPLVKAGYAFTTWNTAANGAGTDYAALATYSANASATLYAQWVVATYTWPQDALIAYVASGGYSVDGSDATWTNVGTLGSDYDAKSGYSLTPPTLTGNKVRYTSAQGLFIASITTGIATWTCVMQIAPFNTGNFGPQYALTERAYNGPSDRFVLGIGKGYVTCAGSFYYQNPNFGDWGVTGPSEHTYIWSYNGAAVTLYVDGAHVATSSALVGKLWGGHSGDEHMGLGSYNTNGTSPLYADVDLVLFYDRQLTPAEIASSTSW